MPHKEITRSGIRIPSVTQVIGCLDKPALYSWYGKYGNEECNRIKRESGEFGTAVHEHIDQYITRNPKTIIYPDGINMEMVMKCFSNFKVWYDNSGLEVISAEPEDAAISKRYNFQGTWDFFGNKKGYPFILPADWKTSNQIYPTVGLQLSAYVQLYGEQQGWTDEEIFKKIPNGIAVRIDKKTAKVYEHPFTDLKYYFDVFKSLLHVYEFHTNTGAWSK